MVSSIQGLAPITNPLNSVLIEKKLINVDQKFIQLVSLAEGFIYMWGMSNKIWAELNLKTKD